MPEENELRDDNATPPPEDSKDEATPKPRRRYFSRRNALFATVTVALLAVLIAILSVTFYRYGVFDNYVKTQFVLKMADIGIVFDADVFRVTVNPLEVELKNATFT